MSFTGRKVLMAGPAYIQFPAGDGCLFCTRPTGHIGIFSLVMAITSDKGEQLYENHLGHKVKKKSSSFWFRWCSQTRRDQTENGNVDHIASDMAPMASH